MQEFGYDGRARTFVDGEDVSLLIREESVARNISSFSDNKKIRDFVNSLLRRWAGENSIIMDGRDIGTVVFPDADIKIYLDASVEVRTARRVKEYSDLGKNVDENSIRNQIIQRDFNDKNREFAPLKIADDALYIDTSDMVFEEVVYKLKGLINRN
jgi:cytidylate kinase